MAATFAEALRLLNEFDIKLTNVNMNVNQDTSHEVKHKFAQTIIVPVCAITNNVDFFVYKGEKYVTTADKVKCKVVEWKELHLLDMEDEVQQLYHISAWDFAKKWYKFDKCLQSMSFVWMSLRKEE